MRSVLSLSLRALRALRRPVRGLFSWPAEAWGVWRGTWTEALYSRKGEEQGPGGSGGGPVRPGGLSAHHWVWKAEENLNLFTIFFSLFLFITLAVVDEAQLEVDSCLQTAEQKTYS